MSAFHPDFMSSKFPQVGRHERLFLSENESDVVFRVGDDTDTGELFHAHKQILTAASEVFDAQFNGSFAEANQDNRENPIVIEDIAPKTFREVLRYIYCEKVQLTIDNVMEVYCASQKYLLTDLTDVCDKFLEETLDLENVLKIFDVNQQYGFATVDRLCLDVIEDNPITFFQSQDFLKLSQSAIEVIAACRTMNCEKAQLCDAIQHWSKVNNLEMDINPRWEALQCRKLFAFSTFRYAQQVGSISTDIQINADQIFHLHGLGVYVGTNNTYEDFPSVTITVEIDSWTCESRTVPVKPDLYVEEMLFEKLTITDECCDMTIRISCTHGTNLFYVNGFKPVEILEGVTITDMTPAIYGNSKTNCVAYLLYNLDEYYIE